MPHSQPVDHPHFNFPYPLLGVLVGSVALAMIVSSCKTTPETQTLSIEEAKQVVIELEDTALAAPPRSLAGLGKLPNDIDDIAEAPACVVPSEKLTKAKVDTVAEKARSSAFGAQSDLAASADEEQRAGNLSNAILLLRKSIEITPNDWDSKRGRSRLSLSRFLAQAGEFGEVLWRDPS